MLYCLLYVVISRTEAHLSCNMLHLVVSLIAHVLIVLQVMIVTHWLIRNSFAWYCYWFLFQL